MTEEEVRTRWEAERPIFGAWGDYVRSRIESNLERLLSVENPPVNLWYFLKIPVEPRLKEAKSLIDKALFRDKPYADPYGDITDKVGMRFVILLSRDIALVQQAIDGCDDWEASKDRDYEEERRERPLEFAYQSVHYVVRAKKEIHHAGFTIPLGTPCEIQIRTLLQHAHSELTHDTIYKPKKSASAETRRTVAKSMALIEAADDFFVIVMDDLAAASKPFRDALNALARGYQKHVGADPEIEKSNMLIIEAFADRIPVDLSDRLDRLIQQKGYIPTSIAKRRDTHHLYRQPAILLAYLLASAKPAETKSLWPLTEDELRSVYLDLGISFDNC